MKNQKIIAAVFVASFFVGNANAGGFFGDIINSVIPGLGTQIDAEHRRVKQANPDYGKAEEKFTNDVRTELGLTPHCEPLYNESGELISCIDDIKTYEEVKSDVSKGNKQETHKEIEQSSQSSNICITAYGSCPTYGYETLGTSCYCIRKSGAVLGIIQ